MNFAAFQTLAGARGDGLRPEFMDLLRRQEELQGSPNVVMLEIPGRRISGPAPAGMIGQSTATVIGIDTARSRSPRKRTRQAS